ncbi:RidA family protein [Heyndrickxia sp. NPDC080065]|uniref:RidA family protein n=1 Tax=Heyndrickxia sp. NPDC080065 TaxID=3390568 RepID=UPI003CFFE798
MRKAIHAKGAVASGPYSHAIDGGEYIFFSGQTSMNTASTEVKPNDIGEQTQQCFDNLFEVFKEANLTPDDVVKVNVYLTDMNYFKEMNAVYEKQFAKPYPARTCVAVVALPLGADVEIEMIAKRS